MKDLNDIRFFVAVVQHQSYSKAALKLNIPKSRLSRRISALEDDLGIRLLERTTRTLRLTDTGLAFYEQCLVVLAALSDAVSLTKAAQENPTGLLQVSCPPGILNLTLAKALPQFTDKYPDLRVVITAQDQRVQLLGDNVDIAIRVRRYLDTDHNAIARELGKSHGILVASPQWHNQHKNITLNEINNYPTLSSSELTMEQSWELLGPDNEVLNISHTPRVASNHFDTIKQAAIQHQGIALLPSLVCMGELQRQELVQLFPDWRGPENIIHAIYPSRHGQSAAVREFIVFLKSVFMKKL